MKPNCTLEVNFGALFFLISIRWFFIVDNSILINRKPIVSSAHDDIDIIFILSVYKKNELTENYNYNNCDKMQCSGNRSISVLSTVQI